MKTSNKILLSLFVLPILLTFGIYIALYAKYKNGDYITQEQMQEERSMMISVDEFTSLDLHNTYNSDIKIQYADSFAIRVDKWNKDNITYNVNGGKLSISNNTKGDYVPLTIFCPTLLNLSLDSANVTIHELPLTKCSISVNGDAHLSFNAFADSLALHVKRGGEIDFDNSASVKTLNLHLDNGSIFNKTGGTIDQIVKAALSDSATLHVDGKTARMLMEKNTP